MIAFFKHFLKTPKRVFLLLFDNLTFFSNIGVDWFAPFNDCLH